MVAPRVRLTWSRAGAGAHRRAPVAAAPLLSPLTNALVWSPVAVATLLKPLAIATEPCPSEVAVVGTSTDTRVAIPWE